jgi:hypothetical protein
VTNNNLIRQLKKYPELKYMILSNLFIILGLIFFSFKMSEVLLLYWVETVIISIHILLVCIFGYDTRFTGQKKFKFIIKNIFKYIGLSIGLLLLIILVFALLNDSYFTLQQFKNTLTFMEIAAVIIFINTGIATIRSFNKQIDMQELTEKPIIRVTVFYGVFLIFGIFSFTILRNIGGGQILAILLLTFKTLYEINTYTDWSYVHYSK